MTVLVLSEEFDPTTDAVVHELQNRNVPVFRFDTAWFPQRLTLDADLTNSGWEATLSTRSRSVRTAEVRAVWYRSPTAFVFADGLSGPERHHAAFEAKFAFGGVLSTLPA